MPRQVSVHVGSIPGSPYVSPGTVGYLGAEGSLTQLDDGSGVITRTPGTYEGVWFRKGLYLSGAGTYVFRSCIFEGTAASWLIVAYDANLGASSTLLFEDCTFRWKAGDTLDAGGSAALLNLGVSVASLIVRRCDVSGKADGLQLAGTCIVEDTYIHDLVWAGTPPDNTHNDGIQCFEGDLTVDGCFIRVGAQNPYSNSCLFFQGGGIANVAVSNSYLSGGGYSYYAQNGAHTVTNCTFNTDNTPADARLKGHLFATHAFEGGGWTLVSWTGNKDHLGNPIAF